MPDADDIEYIEVHGSDWSDEHLGFHWVNDVFNPTLTKDLQQDVPTLLVGEDGNDNISGSDWTGAKTAEKLYGGYGFDSINGLDGDDYLNGGPDGDFLYGNEGNDTVEGEDGDDFISGGSGDDYMNGGDGEDELYGDCFGYCTPGDDWLLGGDDNDILDGEGGDDWLHGSRGNDELIGGDGADSMYGGVDSDEFFGGSGDDTFCDTERYAGPVDGCNQVFDAEDTAGYDKAWMEWGVIPAPTGQCSWTAAPPNQGNNEIELGHGPLDDSPTDAMRPSPTIDAGGGVFSECATLRSVGGVY